MVALNWPSQLPQAPLWDGYQIQPDSGTMRSPTDAGQARQRRRFEGVLSRFDVRWSMTVDQLVIFKAWLAHDARYGARFFNLPLYVEGADPTTLEARFATDPVYARLNSGAWLVSAQLEVRDPPPLTDEALELLLAISLADLQAMALAVDGVTLAPAIATWWSHFPYPG